MQAKCHAVLYVDGLETSVSLCCWLPSGTQVGHIKADSQSSAMHQ